MKLSKCPAAKTTAVTVTAFLSLPSFPSSSYYFSFPVPALPFPPSVHLQCLFQDNAGINPSFVEFAG